jgi:RNA exonuclease 1
MSTSAEVRRARASRRSSRVEDGARRREARCGLTRSRLEQEFAALVRVVKDAQRRFTAAPSEHPGCDFKAWLKANVKRPENQRGDPSRHTAETLRKFVETLGTALGTARVTALTKHDQWRKKRAEWDEWGDDEVVDAKGDRAWALVRRTRKHEGFAEAYYRLPSHEPPWRRTKYRPVRWCVEKEMKPRLLGVDCEMCETDDDTRALVGVSVVDDEGNILLKTLVKPPGNIVDMRTEITGLKAENVLAAPTTLSDVQDRLVELCKPGTVLVGHSLMHDLKSLKIDHQPVIDTGMLFRYKNLPRSTPSLAILCETLLKRKMRQTEAGYHDSVEDAKAALDLVLWAVREAKPIFEVDAPPHKVDAEDLCKLFIHRIPRGTSAEALKMVFEETDRAHIESVQGSFLDVTTTDSAALGGKKTTSCLVTFTDTKRANDAFERLDGAVTKDAIGRAQKSRALPLDSTDRSVSVVVRRMTSSGSVVSAGAAAGAKRPANSVPATVPKSKKVRQRKPKSIALPGDKS